MKLAHNLRGLRNNNPGNIKKSEAFKWDGEVEALPGIETEPTFCQFIHFDYGLRALYKCLLSYQEKHGLNTLEKIINRWAPHSENDTDSYITRVSKLCAHDKAIAFSVKQNGAELVHAIICCENGFNPFSFDYIKRICEAVGANGF